VFGVARKHRQAVALDCDAQILRFALGLKSDLEKAAHVRAIYHYGHLLKEGHGVRQDIPQAIQCRNK
jgi:TPR repeat protein